MSSDEDESLPPSRCRQTTWRREGAKKRRYGLDDEESKEDLNQPSGSKGVMMETDQASSPLQSESSQDYLQGVVLDDVMSSNSPSQQVSGDLNEEFEKSSDSDWSDILVNYVAEELDVDLVSSDDEDEDPYPAQSHDLLSTDSESDSADNFTFDHQTLGAVLEYRQARTVKKSLLLDLAISVRHKLTFECLIQTLVNKNVLMGSKYFPTSKKELWRILGGNNAGIVAHVYCSECDNYLGQKRTLGNFVECECGFKKPTKNAKYFVSIDLKKQLVQFLSLPGVAEMLQYRVHRVKKNEEAIEDIFDGCEYQKLLTNSTQDYSYVFNTDGCKIRKGAKTSIYPLFVRLNELPPNLRQKFMFLAGVFVDTKEPNMMTYLTPFVQQMNNFAEQGILWKPNGDESIRSKFLPSCFCVDGKARWQILNMTSHAGHFACTSCTYPGVYINGTMRYSLEHADVSDYCERTDEGMKADMIPANETNTVVRGHKGPTPLMLMKHLDLAKGNAADDLHYFYECAALQHTELLLRHVRRVDNMGENRMLDLIDTRLKAVKAPSCVSRKPGTCSMKNRKQFTGTEWRNWLLFYAIPCLHNLIPDVYIQHFELLSHAAFLLSQDSVTYQHIDTAQKFLEQYLVQFEELFGIDQTRLNLHSLVHAPSSVKRWGPLWCYTTFNFESWNNKLIEIVSSPQGVLQQIVTRHLIHLNLEMAMHFDEDMSVDVRDQLKQILGKNRTLRARKVSEHTYVFGKPAERLLTEKKSEVLRREELYTENVSVYQKVLIRGIVCRPASYYDHDEGFKSDDSTMYTYQNTFCTIQCIVFFLNQDSHEVSGMFVVEHGVTQPSPFRHARHISEALRDHSDLLHFIRCEEIRAPVVKVSVLGNLYFIPVPNTYDID